MTLPFAHDAGGFGRTARAPSADVRGVMGMIDDRLGAILAAVPPRCRPHFAEALLRVALERAAGCREYGGCHTSAIFRDSKPPR